MDFSPKSRLCGAPSAPHPGGPGCTTGRERGGGGSSDRPGGLRAPTPGRHASLSSGGNHCRGAGGGGAGTSWPRHVRPSPQPVSGPDAGPRASPPLPRAAPGLRPPRRRLHGPDVGESERVRGRSRPRDGRRLREGPGPAPPAPRALRPGPPPPPRGEAGEGKRRGAAPAAQDGARLLAGVPKEAALEASSLRQRETEGPREAGRRGGGSPFASPPGAPALPASTLQRNVHRGHRWYCILGTYREAHRCFPAALTPALGDKNSEPERRRDNPPPLAATAALPWAGPGPSKELSVTGLAARGSHCALPPNGPGVRRARTPPALLREPVQPKHSSTVPRPRAARQLASPPWPPAPRVAKRLPVHPASRSDLSPSRSSSLDPV
ncbi:nascent polypeptide-associated complex subunit alpha, muscle-specific form-like [Canis lupus familiaris]|uniref:nascent polypeptide-associated complex subunit alpha, muscle-specific form-like n=1 Tax=Canis lupus familiaris TaxID=9615 RepID=UPI0018F6FBFC|nr:nascent polypeptide-associated complex subunit alpha, muscle-specific form-like [Canis lupus familiaris]